MQNFNLIALEQALRSEDRRNYLNSTASRRCYSNTSGRRINLFEISCLDLDASAEGKIIRVADNEPDPENREDAENDAKKQAADEKTETDGKPAPCEEKASVMSKYLGKDKLECE